MLVVGSKDVTDQYLIKKLNLNENRIFTYFSDEKYSFCKTNIFYEYVCFQTTKSSFLDTVIKQIEDICLNGYNNEDRYTLILKNFHCISSTKSISQVKYFCEKIKNCDLILTSSKVILNVISFLPFKKLSKILNEESEILFYTDQLISNINKLSYSEIRLKLNNLVLNFHSGTNIIKALLASILKTEYECKHEIINHAAKSEHLLHFGNKDLFYLEHFILFFLNNGGYERN